MGKLLDKAKAVPRRMMSHVKRPTRDEVELMLAYLSGEVTATQAAIALGMPDKNHSVKINYWAWCILREAKNHGILKVTAEG